MSYMKVSYSYILGALNASSGIVIMQSDTPPNTPSSPSSRHAARSKSPISQRALDIASSRALQQEINIQAEPQMPSVAEAPAASPRLRPAKKRVHSIDDLKRFLESNTAKDFLSFILALGESVRGIKLTEEIEISPTVQRILDLLTKLSSWIDEIPPLEQTMRYGNVAFREWHDRLEFSNHLIEEVLGDGHRSTSVELAPYLYDSFGNKSRIDYGTGHETNFFAFLFCLARLGLVGERDRLALATRVIKSYLDLMRRLQITYGLEPAGSHGVWGLDDYQFLPFVLGAAQLINHPTLIPSSITRDEIICSHESHYMFFGCVGFVRKMKKGPLSETSPYLFDISKVPTWSKVYTGLIKMYQGEVLTKFPIMQHFLFGSLIPFPE